MIYVGILLMVWINKSDWVVDESQRLRVLNIGGHEVYGAAAIVTVAAALSYYLAGRF